jgi:uncharacterized protein (DUF58 family)
MFYILVWAILLGTGMHQQINLILLVAGLAAGPVVASIFVSASMLRKLKVSRRVPAYVFSGEPLRIDYTLQNDRRWAAALAIFVQDDLAPVDRSIAGAGHVACRVFFPRVQGQERSQIRWEGISPARGRYDFRSMDLGSRSPFGLLERRLTLVEEDGLIVYPRIGRLTRRWHLLERDASETRRGQRHERSSQQHEYHGLRDYRPGDSPRWIHWRTSARLGQPMVKEFEHQHEQDLAVLIDPWLPRTKVEPKQREAVEKVIEFAATLCYETCRHAGRRLLLGWTGAVPGIRQGPASIKLLHEHLVQLATMRPSAEGGLAPLLDALPPSTLREALIVVISTRPINLYEEAEKSSRLSETSARGLFGRVTLLDVSHGDLADLIEFGDSEAARVIHQRPTQGDQDLASADGPDQRAHDRNRDDAIETVAEISRSDLSNARESRP